MLPKFFSILLCWFLLFQPALGANVRWTGGAVPITQIDTLAIAGDWSATDEDIVVTCGNASFTFTTGATMDTTAEVAAGFEEAWELTQNDPDDITLDFTVSEPPQRFAELREINVRASGSTLYFKSNRPGHPFTISFSETSVGSVTHTNDGTGESVVADGPHHYDNGANWSGGSVPSTGDDLFFDNGDVDLLYDLDYMRTGSDECDIIITSDYGGQIYLPEFNAAGYQEYRTPRYLQIYDRTSASITIEFRPGYQNKTNHGVIAIDGGSAELPQALRSYALRNAGGKPSVLINGGDWEEIEIQEGNFLFSPPESQAITGTFSLLTSLIVGKQAPGGKPPMVRFLPVASFTGLAGFFDCEDITVHSGHLRVQGNTEYGGGGTPTLNVRGGIYETAGDSAVVRDLTVHAGGEVWVGHSKGGSAVGDWVSFGGKIDCSRGADDANLSSVDLYRGSVYYDPDGRGAQVIDTKGCTNKEVDITLNADRKLTITAAD